MNTLLLVHAEPHDESILNSGAVAGVHAVTDIESRSSPPRKARRDTVQGWTEQPQCPDATARAASTIVFGVERIVLARSEHANEQRPETTLFSGLQ